MRCAKCGRDSDDTAPYCAWCGHKHGKENLTRFLGADLGMPDDLTTRGLWLSFAGVAMAVSVVLIFSSALPLSILAVLMIVLLPVVLGAGLTSSWTAWRRAKGHRTRREWLGLLFNGTLFAGFFAVAFGLPMFLHPHYGSRNKQSKSLNNVRQLALAVQQYANDYDETFPGWMTGPDGRPVHNVWDQQIDQYVRSKDIFFGQGDGIRSPSQPPPYHRVLTYGLNGLLIAENNGQGNADWSKGPRPMRPSQMADPANTILFAELSTARSPGIIDPKYGRVVGSATPDTSNASSQFLSAHVGWIDIDPRAWVEQGEGARAYSENTWAKTLDQGVAREFYGGGGVYAFCDGHVKFLKLSRTVQGDGNIAPEANWDLGRPEDLKHNRWWPRVRKP